MVCPITLGEHNEVSIQLSFDTSVESTANSYSLAKKINPVSTRLVIENGVLNLSKHSGYIVQMR